MICSFFRDLFCGESIDEEDAIGLEEATITLKKRGDVSNILKEVERGSYENAKRLMIAIGQNTAKSGGEKLNSLMKSMGSLPYLEEVTFRECSTLHLPLSVHLLQATKSLQKVTFHQGYFLPPTNPDNRSFSWTDTETTDWQLQHLEEIQLIDWHNGQIFRHVPDPEIISWVPLQEAILCRVPSLKIIIINGGQTNVSQLQSLLLNCLLLERMEIKGVEMAASEFTSLAPLLQAHQALHTFLFGSICFGTPQAQEALVDWLTNNTQLQTLQFTPTFHMDVDGDFVVRRSNETQNFKTFLVQTIPRALQNNMGLNKCLVQRSRFVWRNIQMVPLDVQMAWLELVRDHNWVLEELSLGIEHYADLDLHHSLEHYLRLNQLGRKDLQQLSEQLTETEWINKLEMANDSVSCLYELLKMKFPVVTTSLNS